MQLTFFCRKDLKFMVISGLVASQVASFVVVSKSAHQTERQDCNHDENIVNNDFSYL